MKANSTSDRWPSRLGESFPPVLRQQVIDRSSKRAATAKSALIVFTILASLVIGTTVVYGTMRQKPSTTKTITYTTHEEDTLWSIAAHFDPNANTQEVISEIEQLNHLNDNDFLQVDKQLIIPIQK